MKKYIKYLFVLAVLCIGCDEVERPDIKLDNVPPKPVSDVQVRNIPGGAILKFQMPDDEDLLYVKAAYSLRPGHSAEARSSLYCDTIKIQGFGTEDERTVELCAVDRSGNISSPVNAVIKPLEAPVNAIGKTLKMMEDFGGIHLYWQNPERAEISVVLEKEDHNNEFIPVETFYSSMIDGEGAARGMDTIQGNFRAYVQDRWENRSEIHEATLTPIFEELFDHNRFQAMYIQGDEPTAWGWVLPYLFDDNISSGFHTANGSGRWPQWVTFDMGIKGKISRIKVYQRGADGDTQWIYQHGNCRRFEIYGSNDVDNLENWDAWTLMMECTSIKPSGLPLGQYSAEDVAYVAAGEEFICSPEIAAFRYLRLKVLETWSNGDFFHMMEIKIWGQEAK